MTAQQNTLAQTSGNSLDCSFGTKLRRFGAGLAAAAQLGGGTALSGAALLASTQQGDSAVMVSPGTTLPGQAYIEAAQPYVDFMVTVAITNSSTGAIISYGTGFRTQNGIYTPTHVLNGSAGNTITIFNGANFYSPDSVATASSYITHADYMASTGRSGEILDMALIPTSSINGTLTGSFLNFTNIVTTQSLVANGDIVTFAGYGSPQIGVLGTLMPADGYLRAYEGRAVDPAPIFNNTYYNSISTSGFSSTIAGSASPGDSGSLGFLGGVPVGMIVQSSTTRSTYIDFGSELANDFLTIPEPAVLSLAMGGLSLLFRRRRDQEE